MMFYNAGNAFRALHKVLGLDYAFTVLNGGKHCLFKPKEPSKPTIYALFKRQGFVSFGDKGGESINKDWLEVAISQGADFLLFLYPQGEAFKVTPLQVKNYCQKNGCVRYQERKNYIKRRDGSGTSVTVRELTYSFPRSLMEEYHI